MYAPNEPNLLSVISMDLNCPTPVPIARDVTSSNAPDHKCRKKPGCSAHSTYFRSAYSAVNTPQPSAIRTISIVQASKAPPFAREAPPNSRTHDIALHSAL